MDVQSGGFDPQLHNGMGPYFSLTAGYRF